ncbi:MAG: hypothetical protein WC712_03250 [Candidatus Brocadiia bacterium]
MRFPGLFLLAAVVLTSGCCLGTYTNGHYYDYGVVDDRDKNGRMYPPKAATRLFVELDQDNAPANAMADTILRLIQTGLRDKGYVVEEKYARPDFVVHFTWGARKPGERSTPAYVAIEVRGRRRAWHGWAIGGRPQAPDASGEYAGIVANLLSFWGLDHYRLRR